jgi:hypothetical protein
LISVQLWQTHQETPTGVAQIDVVKKHLFTCAITTPVKVACGVTLAQKVKKSWLQLAFNCVSAMSLVLASVPFAFDEGLQLLTPPAW